MDPLIVYGELTRRKDEKQRLMDSKLTTSMMVLFLRYFTDKASSMSVLPNGSMLMMRWVPLKSLLEASSSCVGFHSYRINVR